MLISLCTLVVSSDHNNSDACKTAESNRSCHLGPGRIQHAHTANERQISLDDEQKIDSTFRPFCLLSLVFRSLTASNVTPKKDPGHQK